MLVLGAGGCPAQLQGPGEGRRRGSHSRPSAAHGPVRKCLSPSPWFLHWVWGQQCQTLTVGSSWQQPGLLWVKPKPPRTAEQKEKLPAPGGGPLPASQTGLCPGPTREERRLLWQAPALATTQAPLEQRCVWAGPPRTRLPAGRLAPALTAPGHGLAPCTGQAPSPEPFPGQGSADAGLQVGPVGSSEAWRKWEDRTPPALPPTCSSRGAPLPPREPPFKARPALLTGRGLRPAPQTCSWTPEGHAVGRGPRFQSETPDPS